MSIISTNYLYDMYKYIFFVAVVYVANDTAWF